MVKTKKKIGGEGAGMRYNLSIFVLGERILGDKLISD